MTTEQQEREAFINWANRRGMSTSTGSTIQGDYFKNDETEEEWQKWKARFDKARAALAAQPQAAQELVAWIHEDDPDLCISAAQKATAVGDGGASASSVRPYSIPAYAHPAPRASQAVPQRWREAIDALILRYGNARADEHKAVSGAQHDAAKDISAGIYADLAAVLSATEAAQAALDALDAKRWRKHCAKLDALVTYCPTCCQGFAAKADMTHDEVIFECGKAAGRQEMKDAQARPDFRAWINQAYRKPESTQFTIHNMEVAYQAGRESALQDAPAQPERKPLTDEHLRRMHHEDQFGLFCDYDEFEQIARAIEAAHGIREPQP